MAVGPLEVVLAVSRLRKSGLAVRPPMAEGGVPAIEAAPEVWAVIEKAAVAAAAADPAAREHVLGKPAVATEPPALWAEIEALAVAAARADPAARRHLEGHRSRRFAASSGGPPCRACPRIEAPEVFWKR